MRITTVILLLVFTHVAFAADYVWPTPYVWPEAELAEDYAWPSVPKKVRHIVFATQKFCPPCREVEEKEFPKLKEKGFKIGKLREVVNISVFDINETPDDLVHYPTESTPTFFLTENGKIVDKKVGKQTAEQLEKWYRSPIEKKSVRLQYPRRWKNWTGPDGVHQLYSVEQAIRHLLNDGEHRGKFTRSQLEKMSLAELRALHSDDHERIVKWQYLRN